MRKIFVVTNRSAKESLGFTELLTYQYPNHELSLRDPAAPLRMELLALPMHQWPQLILLDQCDATDEEADSLLHLKELKADPDLRQIPVLMLGAVATQKRSRLHAALELI